MKKNFTLMFMAAALTLGVTGCSKDDAAGGPDIDGAEGKDATVVLNLSFPKTYAADANATAAESAVETVDLFVLNPSTGNIVTQKTFQQSELDDTDKADNKWKASLTTTSGEKKIIAAVNLTNAIRTEIMSKGLDGANNITVHTVGQGVLGDDDNDFVMFSTEVLTQNIIADDVATPGDNDIKIDVERMVAKVSVDGSSADDSPLNGIGTIAPSSLSYTLGNVNTKIYAMQYTSGGVVRDPNYASNDYLTNVFTDADFIELLDTDIADYAAADGSEFRYAPENVADLALQGTNTYVSVKAVFVPDEYSDGTGTPTATTPAAGDTFWMVVTDTDEAKFFDNESDANDFKTAAYTKVGPFVDGVCYYNSYLSKVNGYNVLRNYFYKVSITKIHSIGSPEPGVDPDDKEKPVEGDFATIEVEIDIQPWEVKSEDHELGK